MIISNNRDPNIYEFKSLVDNATLLLNNESETNPDYYIKRNAQLLEDDVKRVLDVTATGTKFEGTIEKISGQRFPDIIAGKYYGIEVKSSKDDKWLTLGGSVNESTRVEGVERIFLTFGKLVNPIEFRSRPYEECLSEVVVTHYPRYKIDMNLSIGDTIFDKMNTTYDHLRSSNDPVGKIIDYYKGQLNEGESLWWTGKVTQNEPAEAVPFKIRLWRTLLHEEKKEFRNLGIALFPEILSNSTTKYERFSLWLAANHGIISTSVRDSFSAGGQETIVISNTKFNKVPRILKHIYDNQLSIINHIINSNEEVLCETWRVDKINDDRIGQWIDCVYNICIIKNLDIRQILNIIFNRI